VVDFDHTQRNFLYRSWNKCPTPDGRADWRANADPTPPLRAQARDLAAPSYPESSDCHRDRHPHHVEINADQGPQLTWTAISPTPRSTPLSGSTTAPWATSRAWALGKSPVQSDKYRAVVW